MKIPLAVLRELPEVKVRVRTTRLPPTSFSTSETADSEQGNIAFHASGPALHIQERSDNNRYQVLDVQFDSEVLVLIRLGLWTNTGCDKLVFLNIYSDLDKTVSCHPAFKNTGTAELGTLDCPTLMQVLYLASTTQHYTELLVRARRIVLWTGSSGTSEFYYHHLVLGVYDGLQISPGKASAYDLPTTHYFEAPEEIETLELYYTNNAPGHVPQGQPLVKRESFKEAVVAKNSNSPWQGSPYSVYSYFGLTRLGFSWITGWGRSNAWGFVRAKFADKWFLHLASITYGKRTNRSNYPSEAHYIAIQDMNDEKRMLRQSFRVPNVNIGEHAQVVGFAKGIQMSGYLWYDGWQYMSAVG
jgi:hypothetical protein